MLTNPPANVLPNAPVNPPVNAKDRRQFLTSALAATTVSALIPPDLAAQPEPPQSANQPPFLLDTIYDPSLSATTLTGEAANRIAIRRLIDAWAYCADRRLADRQTLLFTPDGTITNYVGDPATHKPVSILRGHGEIRAALDVLNKFTATTHFNGQNDVNFHGDQAIGQSYCLAHQLFEENGVRKLQILSIRYQDNFLRKDNRWFFAQRTLIIDWSDTRPSKA